MLPIETEMIPSFASSSFIVFVGLLCNFCLIISSSRSHTYILIELLQSLQKEVSMRVSNVQTKTGTKDGKNVE
jgi:hypothetical protein